MSPTILPTAQRDQGITGQHVLLAMLAFFGIVFAVNGVLLWQALATHSSVVANEPYRKGLAYNDRIAADERQQQLALGIAVTLDRANGLAVAVTDKAGAPVAGLTLTGAIGRPSTGRHDIPIRLQEGEPGRYGTAAGSLEPGSWIVSLEMRRHDGAPDGAVYRIKRRLWLKP